jgi:ATP-binding cassette subfamily F protein 3
MLAGVEQFEGNITPGHNVKQAFYAQHQLESLGLNNEILEELQHFATDRAETELRTVLGCFLFAGDEVFKKIKVLSGGEKARVALAKTLLTEANFLLLDEPTNHLDMRSINLLIQSLQAYEGSFLVVSHDRFFVSEVANKIWWIENEEIKEYLGTYEEFEYWKAKRDEEAKLNKNLEPQKPKVIAQAKAEVKTEESKPKQSNNYLQNLKKQIDSYEVKIVHAKEKLNEIENAFANPDNSSDDKMKELNNFYEAEKKAIQFLEKEMEVLLEELILLEG